MDCVGRWSSDGGRQDREREREGGRDTNSLSNLLSGSITFGELLSTPVWQLYRRGWRKQREKVGGEARKRGDEKASLSPSCHSSLMRWGELRTWSWKEGNMDEGWKGAGIVASDRTISKKNHTHTIIPRSPFLRSHKVTECRYKSSQPSDKWDLACSINGTAKSLLLSVAESYLSAASLSYATWVR